MKNSDIGIFHKEKKKKERSKNAEAKDPSSLTVKKIERVTINGNTIPARYGRKIYNRREKIMNAITDVAQQVLIGLLSAVSRSRVCVMGSH